MKHVNNQLKMLANLAKLRLVNADYKKEDYKNQSKTKASNYFLNYAEGLKKIKAKTEYITINNSIDEKFVKAVIDILNESEDVLNPLGKLSDNGYYETLSDEEKQHYIFKLSENYNVVKSNYLRQKSIC